MSQLRDISRDNRSPSKLVCFVGTDGSGKSTCARIAADWLRANGFDCVQIWGAYDSWLLAPAVKAAKRLLLGRYASPFSDYREYHRSLRRRAQTLVGKWYVRALFVEYWVQLSFKVRCPLLTGLWVVSDRYVIDTTVSIAANKGLSIDEHLLMLDRWLRFFPLPTAIVWVDVPLEVSTQRKRDIPAPRYIEIRRPYYENLAQTLPLTRVDGTLPLDKIEEQLVQLVRRLANGR